jgi:hypothetical protein
MVVFKAAGLVMVVADGLVDSADQVPTPDPAIVAVLFWQIVWSIPALGRPATCMTTVSDTLQALAVHLNL